MNNKEALLAKIAASKRDVADAEERLDAALRELQPGLRAEKTAVTEIVSEAFTKLRAARADLDELERLVAQAVT